MKLKLKIGGPINKEAPTNGSFPGLAAVGARRLEIGHQGTNRAWVEAVFTTSSGPLSHPLSPVNSGLGRDEAIAPLRARWSANRKFVSVKYR